MCTGEWDITYAIFFCNFNFFADRKTYSLEPLLSNVFIFFSSGKYRTNNAKLNDTRIFMHVRKTE